MDCWSKWAIERTDLGDRGSERSVGSSPRGPKPPVHSPQGSTETGRELQSVVVDQRGDWSSLMFGDRRMHR